MSDQPPYGQPYQQPGQPQPYGQPPGGVPPYGGPPQGYWGPPPDHPSATTVLILGILGLVLCQLVAPFAWVMGGRVKREIDESQGRLGGRQNAQIGYVLGIIGSIFLILGVLFFIVYIIFVVILVGTTAST